MSERLTDAVREQAEAIWQIGNRHGPDAERKQDIAESLATFTEALRARVAQLETALKEARPLICGCDVSNEHIAGVRDRLDAALKDEPQ